MKWKEFNPRLLVLTRSTLVYKRRAVIAKRYVGEIIARKKCYCVVGAVSSAKKH